MDIQTLASIISFLAGLATFWVVFFSKTLPALLKETEKLQGVSRFTINLLVLIVLFILCPLFLTAPSINLAWYGWLALGLVAGLVASTLSLLLPIKSNCFSIVGEFFVGPVGGALGGWFFSSETHARTIYTLFGITFASALGLVMLLRLIEYFFHRAGSQESRRSIIGALMLIEAFTICALLSTSSLTTNIAWYDVFTMWLLSNAINLLMPESIYGLNILGEMVIGFFGALLGYFLATSVFPDYSFYAKMGIILATTLIGIIFLRLAHLQYSEIKG